MAKPRATQKPPAPRTGPAHRLAPLLPNGTTFASPARQAVADQFCECGVAVLEIDCSPGRPHAPQLQHARLLAREVAKRMGAECELDTVRDEDGPYVVATIVQV